ncbi:MAG: hypothetical protein R3F40_05050 [Candidatus Competibacteraceae bacterium]
MLAVWRIVAVVRTVFGGGGSRSDSTAFADHRGIRWPCSDRRHAGSVRNCLTLTLRGLGRASAAGRELLGDLTLFGHDSRQLQTNQIDRLVSITSQVSARR